MELLRSGYFDKKHEKIGSVDGEALAYFYDSFGVVSEETRDGILKAMRTPEITSKLVDSIKVPQKHVEIFKRWGVEVPESMWQNYVRNMVETTRFNYKRDKGGYNDRGVEQYASFFGFENIEDYANFTNNLFGRSVPVLDFGSGRHLNNLNFLIQTKGRVDSVIDTTKSKVINLGISDTRSQLAVRPTRQNIMDVQEKYKIIFDVNSSVLYNTATFGTALSLIPVLDKLDYSENEEQAPILLLYPCRDFEYIFDKLERGDYVERLLYNGAEVPGAYRFLKKPTGQMIASIQTVLFNKIRKIIKDTID